MKNREKIKQALRYRRHQRVRSKVSGTSAIPRLVVYKSLNNIQAQLIDDLKGETLVAANDKKSLANQVGELLAKSAKDKGIKKVVFDKGHYKYHGHVKELAEGARTGGLIF